VWHDSFICVTWLIHTCDMTHSYVWYNSFIFVTWHIHISDMTHSCAWHDSFIILTRLIHNFDLMHSYVWHDTSMYTSIQKKCEFAQCRSCDIAPSHVWRDVTVWSVWHDSTLKLHWRECSSATDRRVGSTETICFTNDMSRTFSAEHFVSVLPIVRWVALKHSHHCNFIVDMNSTVLRHCNFIVGIWVALYFVWHPIGKSWLLHTHIVEG